MRKNIEDFFLNLKEPTFLTMKLLYELFEKFEDDCCSKKIVDSISVLFSYDIRLICSEDFCSYVFSEDDLSKIDFAITCYGSIHTVCHEFAHLLLDIFARGEISDKFLEINNNCKRRLTDNKEFVSDLLKEYCDEVFKKLVENIDDSLDFYNRHPELRDEYFRNNSDACDEDLIHSVLINHFVLVSEFDNHIDNCNRVSNVIDAIFCGNNPFILEYGNDEVDPVLAMHVDEYFETGDFGPLVMGFEEQFAEYLVLRTFPEKMKTANQILHNLFGNEWFDMMDKFYDDLTDRVSNKGKVYEYK